MKSLQYDYLLDIQNYPSSYKFYFGDDVKLSDAFFEELNDVDFNNTEEYKKQPYYRYLVNSIWSKRIASEDGFKKMNKKFHEIKSKDIALTLLIGFYSEISRNKEKAEDYFKLIKNNTGSKKFIAAARKKLNSVTSQLAKGEESPVFTYKSIDGKEVSLSDFKGKYVYIDVWATWCGSCIKQIPYLKALEEEFRGRDIVFVSISVDKKEAFSKWEKMVHAKELGGIQLFADNSFASDFIEAYDIHAIPHFILIDKEGKVYDAKAPYPSFNKTKALLEELAK